MTIREALATDYDAIWEIFETVVNDGDTYAFAPETSRDKFEKLWFAPAIKTFVAEEDGKITGSYFIKPNQPGLGSHIANCGYMVHSDARGKGIGGKLCEHSLKLAAETGYRGMQFNIVVSTNTKAVDLWKKFGFRIIGTIPGGFRHLRLGYVDAYIMFREID
jgi:ribosomal protein S18 acetylase RimI-like enzyme